SGRRRVGGLGRSFVGERRRRDHRGEEAARTGKGDSEDVIMRACPFLLAEVASATGGELIGDGQARVAGVSTDTRDALTGSLFVALKGDRFDAHEFLDRAVAGGASALLVSRA